MWMWITGMTFGMFGSQDMRICRRYRRSGAIGKSPIHRTTVEGYVRGKRNVGPFMGASVLSPDPTYLSGSLCVGHSSGPKVEAISFSKMLVPAYKSSLP
jgi:hypothetical protein